ncbi:MAG TPA: alpha-N-arabinofuranosidase [Lachnospiraceae bacterium]
MRKAKLIIEKDIKIGKVDKRIFGSFIEHLGRAVYDGIYQPGHRLSDENGFRKDVMELVKELNVPIIRYPGGNFVSGYTWEDSVGPNRKPRLELAWRALEPNTFGLDEFYKWTQKVNADVMMAVNLGTRGITDACNILEYANHEGGSRYSDLRKEHGRQKPYHIKTWCLGNEMDGDWQIGHKTMQEYGRLANECGRAMKMIDPDIELVACGSSGQGMPTFPDWEASVLYEAYDVVDYVSMHTYYDNYKDDTADFLAKSDDMDAFIKTVIATCDYVQAKRRGKKQINISFDEWNVWYHSNMVQDDRERKPWTVGMQVLEDIYNMEDALLVGLMLITLLKHADRVKIAALAQLVNVIAPIFTMADGGDSFKQTIFYPFLHASKYGRGEVLRPILISDRHSTSQHDHVTDVESVAVLSEDGRELTVFAVNRNIEEDVDFVVDLRDLKNANIKEHIELANRDLKAYNSVFEQKVVPIYKKTGQVEDGKYHLCLAKASWNVLRFIIE